MLVSEVRLVLAGVVVAVGVLVGVPAPHGGFVAPGGFPDATVVIHGRGGTFGLTEDTLPSGHPLGHRVVPGWAMPGGAQGWRVAVGADGTVVRGGRSSELKVEHPSSPEVV